MRPATLLPAALLVCLSACDVGGGAARPLGKPFPTPTPETVFRKDPCTLLTRTEVEQAVGNALAEPTRSAAPGLGHDCLFAPTGPGGWIVGLDVTTPATLQAQGRFTTPGVPETPAGVFQRQRTAKAVAVSGLGDSAAWDPEANRLMVLRGQLLLQLVFLKRGGQFDAAKAEALARTALSRA